MKRIKRYYFKALSIADYNFKKLLFLHLRFLVVSNSKKGITIRRINLPHQSDSIIEYKCEKFINHYYDILGSGWINNSYDSNRLEYLRKIQKKVHSRVDADYLPHDWHKDAKSGFVWSDTIFCKDALKVVGNVPNLEIKYPWEFSRFYHLPILAIGSRQKKLYTNEIKNQLIDFYYSNPVGLGVNWSCTMDVGIRIHNILVALSLYEPSEKNKEFDILVSNLILDHGNFIYSFLENKSTPNNNHYLANLLGLISIAYFTEVSEKTIKWAVFAYREFIKEFNIQFNPDGSNFEGSSCYHALSTEMYILFTAYTLGLSEPIKESILSQNESRELFDETYITKLSKSVQFIKDLSFANNEIAQIGDNDSGFIFKLTNNGKMYSNGFEMNLFENLKISSFKSTGQDYWDENLLCKNYLADRYSGLFTTTDLNNQSFLSIEKQYIVSITKNNILPSHCIDFSPAVSGNKIELNQLKYKKSHVFTTDFDLSHGVRLFNYPHFGVCGFKATNFELIFSYSKNGLHGKGGHAHNDKLSFGLSINDEVIFSDPGTYLYHPSPEWRNYFRSTKSHNTIFVENIEQNNWNPGKKGIFRLSNRGKSELLTLNNQKLVARFINDSYEHVRIIDLTKQQIIVTDYCDKEFESNFHPNEYFSPGYGKIIKNSVEGD